MQGFIESPQTSLRDGPFIETENEQDEEQKSEQLKEQQAMEILLQNRIFHMERFTNTSKSTPSDMYNQRHHHIPRDNIIHQSTSREMANLSKREIVRQLNRSEEKEEHGRVENVLGIVSRFEQRKEHIIWSFRDFVNLNIDKALGRLEPSAKEALKEIQETLKTCSDFNLFTRKEVCFPLSVFFALRQREGLCLFEEEEKESTLERAFCGVSTDLFRCGACVHSTVHSCGVWTVPFVALFTQASRESARCGFGSHKKIEYIVVAENGKVEFYLEVTKKNRAINKVIKLLGSGAGAYFAGFAVAWAVSDDPKEDTWGGSFASYLNYVAGNSVKAARVVFDKIPRWH